MYGLLIDVVSGRGSPAVKRNGFLSWGHRMPRSHESLQARSPYLDTAELATKAGAQGFCRRERGITLKVRSLPQKEVSLASC